MAGVVVASLTGRTILLTRPQGDHDALAPLLLAQGAHVLHAPMIHFDAPADPAALTAALQSLTPQDVVILTSVRAVAAVATRIPCAVVALAKRTREACVEAGLRVLPVRDAVDGEDLAAAMVEALDVSTQRFLMVQSDVAQPAVVEALRRHGARVEDVVGYQTLPAKTLPDEVAAALEQGRVDAVVCMSPSAVDALCALCDPSHLRPLVRAAPGKTTAAAWQHHGLPAQVVTTAPTPELMLDALLSALAR